MNQHDYVKSCLAYYQENGLTPGDPNCGKWEVAHYPVPECEHGEETLLLLHEHHQVQGLLQSEEYGRSCFFCGHAKRFLLKGPFVENWFELWDLYEKWAPDAGKRSAELARERGTGLFALTEDELKERGRKAIARLVEKDPDHQRKASKAAHSEKNEKGQSLHSLKTAAILHAEKDEKGRSLHAVRTLLKVHEVKDEDGKSKHAKERGRVAGNQKWEDPDHPELGLVPAGVLVRKQKARKLPHGKENRRRVG